MEHIIYFKNSILIYLLCGLFFCFLYDKLVDNLPEQEENRLTWGERLAVMILWPITLVVFVYHFLYAFFKDDE